MPAIRYDRRWSRYQDGQTVVVTCTACPSWSRLALAENEARTAASAHLTAVHAIEERRALDRTTRR